MSVLPDSYSYQRGAGPVLHQLTTPLSSRLRCRSNRFGHALNLEAHNQHESDADNANDISFTLPPAFEADDSASDHSDADNASSESVIEEAMSCRQTKAPQGRAAPAPAKKPCGRPKKTPQLSLLKRASAGWVPFLPATQMPANHHISLVLSSMTLVADAHHLSTGNLSTPSNRIFSLILIPWKAYPTLRISRTARSSPTLAVLSAMHCQLQLPQDDPSMYFSLNFMT